MPFRLKDAENIARNLSERRILGEREREREMNENIFIFTSFKHAFLHEILDRRDLS